jgi:hypothetical protein
LHTAFVHVIDAASLALIVPILQRGLRERNATVKKTAAQITGNMCVLLIQPLMQTQTQRERERERETGVHI